MRKLRITFSSHRLSTCMLISLFVAKQFCFSSWLLNLRITTRHFCLPVPCTNDQQRERMYDWKVYIWYIFYWFIKYNTIFPKGVSVGYEIKTGILVYSMRNYLTVTSVLQSDTSEASIYCIILCYRDKKEGVTTRFLFVPVAKRLDVWEVASCAGSASTVSILVWAVSISSLSVNRTETEKYLAGYFHGWFNIGGTFSPSREAKCELNT